VKGPFKIYNKNMMMDSFSRLLSFSFLCLVLGIGAISPVYAQDEQLVVPNVSRAAPETAETAQPNVSLPPSDEEVTILRDDYAGKYNLSTLQNLSKLYWRLGAFDFEDDLAVGNYLKINDCKIFTEYLNDDLEWKEIVRVMQEHLRAESATFPLNYQFVLQLHLGRYEPERGGFPLVDRTGFIDAKRIEVDSLDHNREICYDHGTIKDYPKSIVLLLPEPFTLDFIKLDEHVAQAFILRKKSEYNKLADEQKVRAYERDAYLRLRVTFSQYHGNLRGDGNQTMAILFGNIDGYEIFEDAGQKRLMASVDMKKKAAAEPLMSIPTNATASSEERVIAEEKPAAAIVPSTSSMGFAPTESTTPATP
jgi:Domain of unknown function (DUF4852)